MATKDPVAVEAAVQAAYYEMFPKGDRLFIARIFGWASDCFNGRYADYQAIDARYHDFEHTLQGTLCMARILSRRHAIKVTPILPQRLVELGLLAILLHDTGYLKKRDDTEGTGAKYTVTHVGRSADFAAQLLADKGFLPTEIKSIQNMIRCTGVDAVMSSLHFQNETEKLAGFALGTADLLGQMSPDDYLEKLPVLYSEFAEAGRYSSQKTNIVSMFSSAKDLLQKTPGFWDKYVKLKLDRDFGGMHRFLADPYPGGPNYYMDKIEANITRLRERIANNNTLTFTR